jgi:hypothetical protein
LTKWEDGGTAAILGGHNLVISVFSVNEALARIQVASAAAHETTASDEPGQRRSRRR